MKTPPIIAGLILIARIFIIIKISVLLFQTGMYPESYPVSSLTWWIYLLVFDIWVLTQIPMPEEKTDDDNNE